jgi:glutaredoxin
MVTKKDVKKKDRPCVKAYKAMKKNPWIISTVVLAVIVLGFFAIDLFFDNEVSGDTAAQNLIDFAAAQGAQLELVGVEEVGGLYEITVKIQGQEGQFYVTKDSKYYSSMILPLEMTETPAQPNQPEPTEVPKSDKPEVELYIWSYCPYGVQAQSPLSEVVSLLEGSIDVVAVPFHDGHGEYENQQNKIQSCIQEIDSSKYWDYATGFVEDIYSICGATRDAECDESESVKLMNSLGINSAAVLSCVETKGDELFSDAKALASQNGVSGSPTLIINGVKVNSARTAEAYKTAICSAFNDAPEECGEVLDSEAAAAAGSC